MNCCDHYVDVLALNAVLTNNNEEEEAGSRARSTHTAE